MRRWAPGRFCFFLWSGRCGITRGHLYSRAGRKEAADYTGFGPTCCNCYIESGVTLPKLLSPSACGFWLVASSAVLPVHLYQTSARRTLSPRGRSLLGQRTVLQNCRLGQIARRVGFEISDLTVPGSMPSCYAANAARAQALVPSCRAELSCLLRLAFVLIVSCVSCVANRPGFDLFSHLLASAPAATWAPDPGSCKAIELELRNPLGGNLCLQVSSDLGFDLGSSSGVFPANCMCVQRRACTTLAFHVRLTRSEELELWMLQSFSFSICRICN